MPFVLLKTILDLDPNDPNPALQKIARIWKHEAAIPLGTGASATRWTFDHIGVGPTPYEYVDCVGKALSEREATVLIALAATL